VTLVGELSDASLRRFKELGLAEIGKTGRRVPKSMVKVRVYPNGEAWALFGDSNCRQGQNGHSVSFVARAGDNAPAPEAWTPGKVRVWSADGT